MSSEEVTIQAQSRDLLTTKTVDGKIFEFQKKDNKWLLKNNTTPNSLLQGTIFV